MLAKAFSRSAFLSRTTSHARVQASRWYAISAGEDLRAKLTEGMKASMKARDSSKTTVIRSMLSEVYDADKKKQEKVATPVVQALIRKAVQRRKDAAKQYESGSRADLASQELAEAAILEDYLPPLLPSSDVDRILYEVISANEIKLENPVQLNMIVGKVFKAFYAKVDKSTVDSDYLKKKAEEILKS